MYALATWKLAIRMLQVTRACSSMFESYLKVLGESLNEIHVHVVSELLVGVECHCLHPRPDSG